MKVMLTANAAWNVLNFRMPLVQALQDDGHQVSILAPPDETVSALECNGCRFLPLKMSVKGLNPLNDLALMWHMRSTFRVERPDVVLSYTIKNNIFGAMAAQSAGVHFIPNVTGLGTAFLSGGLLQSVAEGLYRRAFASLPVVFFQNHDDKQLFISRKLVRHDQAKLLPGSGVDLYRFPAAPYPPGDDAPTFLMIARLLRDKGVAEFAEAARIVKNSFPRTRFQLLGALGSENRTAISREDLDTWVKQGLVEYLGVTEDVRPYIAASHCVVLPSYREGAPRTLIEAASMARPVITTDVPGCRSVVDVGVSGLLCKPRDAESLASAVRNYIALLPEQKARMGLAGRAKMEREFDQALVVGAYRGAISNLQSTRLRA